MSAQRLPCIELKNDNFRFELRMLRCDTLPCLGFLLGFLFVGPAKRDVLECDGKYAMEASGGLTTSTTLLLAVGFVNTVNDSILESGGCEVMTGQ